MNKSSALDKIQKLRESQVEIARAVGSQELLVALYGRSASEVADSFREDVLGFAVCDERARLSILIEELGEAFIRSADVEYDQGRRSNGWQDQSRSEMRDKAILALEHGRIGRLFQRRGSFHDHLGLGASREPSRNSWRLGRVSLGLRRRGCGRRTANGGRAVRGEVAPALPARATSAISDLLVRLRTCALPRAGSSGDRPGRSGRSR